MVLAKNLPVFVHCICLSEDKAIQLTYHPKLGENTVLEL